MSQKEDGKKLLEKSEYLISEYHHSTHLDQTHCLWFMLYMHLYHLGTSGQWKLMCVENPMLAHTLLCIHSTGEFLSLIDAA